MPRHLGEHGSFEFHNFQDCCELMHGVEYHLLRTIFQVIQVCRSSNLLEVYFHHTHRCPAPASSHHFNAFGHGDEIRGFSRSEWSHVVGRVWRRPSSTSISVWQESWAIAAHVSWGRQAQTRLPEASLSAPPWAAGHMQLLSCLSMMNFHEGNWWFDGWSIGNKDYYCYFMVPSGY